MYGRIVLSASGLHTWRCLVSLALNVLRTRHHTALCGDNWDDGCPDKISVTMAVPPYSDESYFEDPSLKKNDTIKAGGSTKRAQNVGLDWSGWMDGWIPLRLLRLLEHLRC